MPECGAGQPWGELVGGPPGQAGLGARGTHPLGPSRAYRAEAQSAAEPPGWMAAQPTLERPPGSRAAATALCLDDTVLGPAPGSRVRWAESDRACAGAGSHLPPLPGRFSATQRRGCCLPLGLAPTESGVGSQARVRVGAHPGAIRVS